jgi:hypothetical protein
MRTTVRLRTPYRADDRAEDDEGHTVGQLAELAQEVGLLPHGVTLECAEYEAGDKRGDEAAASERRREPVGKRRGGCRQDLAPGRVHQAVPPRHLYHERSHDARDRSEEDAVADRLDNERKRGVVTRRAGLGFGEREPDEQQGHADPVVEP